MLSLPPSVPIFLATEPVDMRKGIDGLFAIVRQRFGADPFSGGLFVFHGRNRNRLKVLVWDQGGFLLLQKRLERGTFRLPVLTPGTRTVSMTATELSMLLSGFDLRRVTRPTLWTPPEKNIFTGGSTSP